MIKLTVFPIYLELREGRMLKIYVLSFISHFILMLITIHWLTQKTLMKADKAPISNSKINDVIIAGALTDTFILLL